MKTTSLLMIWMTLLLGHAAARAETGFFLGGSGQIQMVPGQGTWAGTEFKIKEPLSSGEDAAVGFSWNDNFVLGVKPLVGYRLGDRWAFQATYGLNIPKTSQQTYSESNSTTYYSQSLSVDWSQRSLEILGVYYPDGDLQYFLYGGVDLVRIKADVSLYESVGAGDQFGNEFFSGELQMVSDDIDAMGLIVGAGVLVPAFGQHSEGFLSAQYSTAKTDDAFFGTEDFKVTVGGFTLQFGVKWYPFAGDDD